MELTPLVRAAKGSREQQVNWGPGNSAAMGTCPLCLHAPASRDEPTEMGSTSKAGLEGTDPCRF